MTSRAVEALVVRICPVISGMRAVDSSTRVQANKARYGVCCYWSGLVVNGLGPCCTDGEGEQASKLQASRIESQPQSSIDIMQVPAMSRRSPARASVTTT